MLRMHTIISREEWGAVQPKVELPTMHGLITGAILTFTDTTACSTREECILEVQRIQRKHMDCGRCDIPYNLFSMDQLPPGSRWDFDNIVVREKWKAQDPFRYDGQLGDTVSTVIFTYTDTDPCNTPSECSKEVHNLQRYHMRYHLASDIPYSFLLGGDGRVYTGRTWHWVPTVPPEYMDKREETIVIARIGPPSDDPKQQLEDFRQGYNLLHYAAEEGLVTPDFKIIKILKDWNTYDKDNDDF